MSTILDAANMSELNDFEDVPNLESQTTDTPDNSGKMTFNVIMNGYTLRGFESLVVETAARLIVGKLINDDGETVRSMIESRCRDLITNAVLPLIQAQVDEAMKRPILAGANGKTPMTFAEYITDASRAFLNERVSVVGRENDHYAEKKPRIERIVEHYVGRRFKEALENSISKTITEVQAAVCNKMETDAKEVKGRLYAAIKSTLGEKA